VGVGARLQRAREERGCSLESIATRTRVPPRILAAIEREEFQRVRSGIFLRGYLRAFATELGLDPDDVVHAYLEQVSPAPKEDVRVAPEEGAAQGDRGPDRRTTSAFVVAGAAVLLLVVMLWPRGDTGLTTVGDDEDAEAAASSREPGVGFAPVSTGSTPDSSASPVALASDGASSRAGRPEAVAVTLVARAPVWVSGTSDGERVIFRTLEAGERVALSARDELELRVGDAGALDLVVRGQAPQVAGRVGEVRTVIVRRQDGRVAIQ
jgi:cytoskeleton protein RodZ